MIDPESAATPPLEFDTDAARDWANSVSSISGLGLDQQLSEPVMGDLMMGIMDHEGGAGTFDRMYELAPGMEYARYIREGTDMYQQSEKFGPTPGVPAPMPSDMPSTGPDLDAVSAPPAATTEQVTAVQAAVEDGKQALAASPLMTNPVRFVLEQTQIVGYDGSVLADRPYTDMNEAEKIFPVILGRFLNNSSTADGGRLNTAYGEGKGQESATTWRAHGVQPL